MMKRNYFFLLFVLAYSHHMFSQQLPHYSQYMFNPFLINPAIAGTTEDMQAQIGFRSQWAGFTDAPQTGVASFHTSLLDNMGAGGILFRDKTGPITRTGAELVYSYRLNINEQVKLSFGLEGMIYQHVLDNDALTLDQPSDQAVLGGQVKDVLYDADAGIYLYSAHFFTGISVPQVIQSKIDMSELNSDLNRLARHYFFHIGYDFNISEEFALQPSVLFKAIVQAPAQVDINAKLIYKEFVWLGLSYRHRESTVVMLGIQKGRFLTGYSYDITLSNIRRYSSGSHEIMVGMNIGKGIKESKSSIE